MDKINIGDETFNMGTGERIDLNETKTIIVNVEIKMVVKTEGDILSQVRDTIEVMNDIILMSEIEADPFIQNNVTSSVIFDYNEDEE